MPTITLHPSGKTITAEHGESIFAALRRNDVPIGSSCAGDGVCDKCRVLVLRGAERLSNPSDAERRHFFEHGVTDGERLACQTVVIGDVTITTGYW